MQNFHPTPDVLSYYECEKLIETLSPLSLKSYGSQKWLNQNNLISKLNLQAHINASTRGEEYVMELLSTHNKLKILLNELLVSFIWKKKILPNIKGVVSKSGIRSYLSIFHEGVVCNLLEIVCYHKTALEAFDANIIDFLDYIYEKLSFLVNDQNYKKFFREENSVNNSGKNFDDNRDDFFEENLKKVEFEIQMSCLSILRYISDNLKYLPVSATTYLLNEKDILMVLVSILENKPWILKTKDGVKKWENRKFVKKDDVGLCKEEGQVWLTIYNLIFQEECAKNYEINDFRKNNLLRLKKYLTDTLLDQIPVLSSLQRVLEEMSIMKVNTNFKNNPFIIQTVPQLKKKILSENIQEIISDHKKLFSKEFEKNDKEILNQITDTYSHSIIYNKEKFKCGNCGEEATKKCSRCKSIYYCTVECQKNHYKSTHKKVCKKIAIENGFLKEENLVLKSCKRGKDVERTEEKEKEVKVVIDYEELC